MAPCLAALATLLCLSGCRTWSSRIPTAEPTDGVVRGSTDLPRDAALAFLRSRQAVQLGDLHRALDQLQRAAAFDPASAPLAVRTAQLEHLLGRSENAVRHCQRALRLDPDTCEAHLLLGQVASYQDLDLGRAEASLRRAVECDPSVEEAWHELAAVLRTQQRWEEYQLLLDDYRPHATDESWALHHRAMALLELGRADEALADLVEAVEAEPEDVAILRAMVRAHDDADRPDEVIVVLEDLVRRFPSVIELRGELAAKYAAVGRYDEVIDQLLAEYEQDPRDRDLHALRAARWLDLLLRHDEATELLEQTLEDDPGNAQLLVKLGWVRESAGDMDGACAAWSAIDEDQPLWSVATRERARVLAEDGRAQEGIEVLAAAVERSSVSRAVGDIELIVALTTALSAADRHTEALQALEPLEVYAPDLYATQSACARHAMGEFDRAVLILNEQISHSGVAPGPALVLASLYRQEALYDEGVEVLRHALQRLESPAASEQLGSGRYPTRALRRSQIEDYRKEVLTALAFLEGLVGDREQSLDTMRAVLLIDPDDVRALNYIGYTLAVQGRDLLEAERMLRRALTLSPLDPAILDSLGWALFRLGRYDDALDALSQASLRMPESAVIWQHLGEVHLAMDRRDEALASLRLCVDTVDPGDPEAEEAAERAAELLEELQGASP